MALSVTFHVNVAHRLRVYLISVGNPERICNVLEDIEVTNCT